jgi:hypothetical protein
MDRTWCRTDKTARTRQPPQVSRESTDKRVHERTRQSEHDIMDKATEKGNRGRTAKTDSRDRTSWTDQTEWVCWDMSPVR